MLFRSASFFGTTPERVILTPSVTTALNMAIKGFALNKVVTSSMEHNAVLRPLHSMARREEIALSFFTVPPRDDAVVLGFTKALEGAYTAAFIHTSNVNGRILPLKLSLQEVNSIRLRALSVRLWRCCSRLRVVSMTLPVCKAKIAS